MPSTDVRAIEAATDRGWPAPQHLFGDWLLRFGTSPEVRPRAASYLGRTVDADELLRQTQDVVRWYDRRSLPTYVQIIESPRMQSHSALNAALANSPQFAVQPPSYVATATVGRERANTSARGQCVLEPLERLTSEAIGNTWWDNHELVRSTAQALSVPSTGVRWIVDGRTVGLARAAVADAFVGLFNLFVQEAYQRRGIGSALLSRLLSWGGDHGATQAFLQVLASNVGALKLYERMDFGVAYSYWYFLHGHSTPMSRP